VFSHLIARRPGDSSSRATPVRPAQAASIRVPARAARPLVAIVACAAAVTIAGCKPGILGSASSSATPSPGTGAASSGTGQSALSAAKTMTALARNARGVRSFAATLQIHSTGSAGHVSGILTEQTRPSFLVDVRTRQPAGLEAVLTSNTAYLRIGALTQTAGRPWVAVPNSGLANGSNASVAPMIQQMQGSNPLAQAQMFPAAMNVREIGTSTINGVPTTQYAGSYSLAAGLAQLAQGLRAPVRSGMMSSGITSTKFTVWVDAKHQVRKMSLVEFGRSTRVEIVLVIVSVNQPVQIKIPPASQVAGATVTPAPAMTPTPARTGTPMPARTVAPTPAPGTTRTPAPVTSSAPAPTPSSGPTHW
jgi:hypothetical protein